MPIFAKSPEDADLKAIREGTLIHLSLQSKYAGIVQSCTSRPGAEQAFCEIYLKPTMSRFKNLTILDPARVQAGPKAGYVYWFLGEPKGWQRGLNTDNLAFLRLKPSPNEMRIEVPGAAALERCGGRLFFRASDKCVASFGEYRGSALVGPIPIR